MLIGSALKKLFEDGVVKREDLWITSKLCLGNMISMKNEGTAQVLEGTARRYRVIHEFWFLDGFGSRMLRLRGS
ncbi:aldo/keto reductase [Tanacetum coccineum]